MYIYIYIQLFVDDERNNHGEEGIVVTYMCVYIYVCMCMCVYIYIYIHMFIYIHTHISTTTTTTTAAATTTTTNDYTSHAMFFDGDTFTPPSHTAVMAIWAALREPCHHCQFRLLQGGA